MFGLAPNQLGAIVVGIVAAGFVAYQYVPWSSLKKWTTKKPTTAKPDRKAIMGLLDDAFAYFDEAKCAEGKAAIKTAMTHVYAEHPHS